MKRSLISALTFLSVIAPVGVASASTPVAERIDGYVLRAEVEADRMQFENCMERLNAGETSLQHCVPQWAPPIVVETTTTTTTTTIPTTETTVPPVTTPPTTTVAPAPTTTVPPAPTTTLPPADPVEACIEDYSGCLTDAVHVYMDAAWTIADYQPSFAVDAYYGDSGWVGRCKGVECGSFSTLRYRVWEANVLSFADFTTFASNWCPVNPGQEGNTTYKAACNTSHPAGGNYKVLWSAGLLEVTWQIPVANSGTTGYNSWSDWYRGTH